jgi:hypothetical protein
MDAVLMLFVSLVQGARTTLGMIFNRTYRDWHTESAHENLPQAKPGNSSQESHHTHGVILGLVPRISVGTAKGLAFDPLDSDNQDSRHKAENGSVDVASPAEWKRTPLVRVPREGGGPDLRAEQTSTGGARSALTRAAQTPACAGDTVDKAVRNSA